MHLKTQELIWGSTSAKLINFKQALEFLRGLRRSLQYISGGHIMTLRSGWRRNVSTGDSLLLTKKLWVVATEIMLSVGKNIKGNSWILLDLRSNDCQTGLKCLESFYFALCKFRSQFNTAWTEVKGSLDTQTSRRMCLLTVPFNHDVFAPWRDSSSKNNHSVIIN